MVEIARSTLESVQEKVDDSDFIERFWMDFERAATLRDRISHMQDQIGEPLTSVVAEDNEKRGKGRRGRRRGGSGRQQRGKVPRPRKME